MKRAKVEISLILLGEFLKGNLSSQEIFKTTAPQDLKVVAVDMDVQQILNGTSFFAYVESETFEEVHEGKLIPQIKPFEYTVGPINEKEMVG